MNGFLGLGLEKPLSLPDLVLVGLRFGAQEELLVRAFANLLLSEHSPNLLLLVLPENGNEESEVFGRQGMLHLLFLVLQERGLVWLLCGFLAEDVIGGLVEAQTHAMVQMQRTRSQTRSQLRLP